MTEQQIDAEACRYEPYHNYTAAPGVARWHWFCADSEEWHGPERDTLPARIWRHIRSAMVYPTRAAAFADLRQAIAASGTNAGS